MNTIQVVGDMSAIQMLACQIAVRIPDQISDVFDLMTKRC